MRPEAARRLHLATLEGAGAGTHIELDDAARQHAKVLRLKDGAPLELFDGHGRLAQAVFHGDTALLGTIEFHEEPRPRLGLIQGLPKGAKSDDIVRMATEMGAAQIVFVVSEYSAASLAKADNKRARWARVALESARQSERLYLPEIADAGSLGEAISMVPRSASRFYAWARGGGSASFESEGDRWVCVGPEGGWSDAERSTLAAAGFEAIRLGPHILRVDTAATAALSLLAR